MEFRGFVKRNFIFFIYQKINTSHTLELLEKLNKYLSFSKYFGASQYTSLNHGYFKESFTLAI